MKTAIRSSALAVPWAQAGSTSPSSSTIITMRRTYIPNIYCRWIIYCKGEAGSFIKILLI